jgi:hypothetical protein
MIEDDLEADVARLRDKWFGTGVSPVKTFEAEDNAVAGKWIGKAAAHKLANSRDGERYRPPDVTARYGYIPEADGGTRSPRPLGNYWYVEVTRDGRNHTVFEGDRTGCLQALSMLERMRVPVMRIGSERSPDEMSPPARSKPHPSARHDILKRLGSFGA